MCRPVVVLILTLTAQTGLRAQTPKLPFEATVTVAETYVRSGPGPRFYPTSKLKRGTRVHVRRKDLGGWYMIDPPAGSFSWIRAEYVDRSGSGRRGSLNAKNIVVRVGSQFGTTRDVEQRRLSVGDAVDILDEATLDTNGVAIRMYKISPPRGEYRWIAGSSVMASDKSIRSLHDRDPYRVPSQVQRDETGRQLEASASPAKQPGSQERLFRDAKDVGGENTTVEQRPLVRSRDDGAKQTDASVALEAEQEQLRELDDQFRQMIGTDTAQWDLTQLEQAYRALLAQTESFALQQQIELRFPAVEKYKKIQREYEKFVSLTNETQKRDAQLLTMQGDGNRNTAAQPTVAAQPAAPPQTRPETANAAATNPATGNATATNPATGNPAPGNPAPGQRPAIASPPRRFVGAGIVQINRIPTRNVPQYVLITPAGRLLAYLQAERGVNLSQFVGRSVGLDGRRWFRADLRADNILVRNATPVRLRSK